MYRGTGVGKAVIGLLCLAALSLCGCANKDPAVARVEGAEPQRLSFGAPAAVQQSFTEQMKACWFNGPSALLAGFQYDTKPSNLETADGLVELQQISIFSEPGPRAQTFIIQFNAFNENTLISTRNVSFPPELAAKLKRDVETWIFGRSDCKDPAIAQGAVGPSITPQTSSLVQHAAATNGWTPK
jgi:hypothetical protein